MGISTTLSFGTVWTGLLSYLLSGVQKATDLAETAASTCATLGQLHRSVDQEHHGVPIEHIAVLVGTLLACLLVGFLVGRLSAPAPERLST